MLGRAGQVVGPRWKDFNDQRCLRLTLPRPQGFTDLRAHRFHMTMEHVLLPHMDALAGYKYCDGVDNNHPEEDVWITHRWIAELGKHTERRVLPKRLAEPINRLIAVVANLHRDPATALQYGRLSDA